jgi:hypothetical protein
MIAAAGKVGGGLASRIFGTGTAVAGAGVFTAATSDFAAQWYRGQYGTGPSAERQLGALSAAGGAAGAMMVGFGGFRAVTGRGVPLLAPIRGAARIGEGARAWAAGRRGKAAFFKNKGAGEHFLRTGKSAVSDKRFNKLMGAYKRGAAGLRLSNKNMLTRHPFMTAFAGGVGFGGASAYATGKISNAPEGNITAIHSSPSGGISPELQFSTQGLTLALHKNRSRTF